MQERLLVFLGFAIINYFFDCEILGYAVVASKRGGQYAGGQNRRTIG